MRGTCPEYGRKRAELAVRLDGLAPDLGVLAAGVAVSLHFQPPGVGERPPPRTASAIMPDPTDPEPETSIASSSPTVRPAMRPEMTSGRSLACACPRGEEERAEDHRLASSVRWLRLELREREPPVHPAPRRADTGAEFPGV